MGGLGAPRCARQVQMEWPRQATPRASCPGVPGPETNQCIHNTQLQPRGRATWGTPGMASARWGGSLRGAAPGRPHRLSVRPRALHRASAAALGPPARCAAWGRSDGVAMLHHLPDLATTSARRRQACEDLERVALPAGEAPGPALLQVARLPALNRRDLLQLFDGARDQQANARRLLPLLLRHGHGLGADQMDQHQGTRRCRLTWSSCLSGRSVRGEPSAVRLPPAPEG